MAGNLSLRVHCHSSLAQLALTRRAHVFYHYPCPDGIFSALAAHRFFLRAGVTLVGHPMKVFLPAANQVNLNDISQEDVVYIMDYTGDVNFLRDIASRSALDEIHAKQKENFFPSNISFVLDMARSGATISRDYFRALLHPPPSGEEEERLSHMYNFIEDADIWKWTVPHSKEFSAGFASLQLEMDCNVNPSIFDTLVNLNIDALIQSGAASIEAETAIIKADLDTAFRVTIPAQAGHAFADSTFLAVITGHPELRSRMGNELAEISRNAGFRGIAAIVCEEGELGPEKYKVSLRSLSKPVNENAAEICKAFGGGGHVNAASFNVDRSLFNSWRS